MERDPERGPRQPERGELALKGIRVVTAGLLS